MWTYWLTFRIPENKIGQAARQEMERVIEDYAEGSIWKEPTSFIAFKSIAAPGLIAEDLRLIIEAAGGLAVLHPVNKGPAYVIGEPEFPDVLKDVLPNTLRFKG
ncbi:hypothetical protein FHR71_001193 [Methylobacterium sp. RAS18]|nr:hypothetical protein [Methylobacterium sp. RAS18]